MKKMFKLFAVAALLVTAMPLERAYAQENVSEQTLPGFDRNHLFNVYVGNFDYSPKTKQDGSGSKVLDVLAAVITGEINQNHDSYSDAVRSEIIKGLSHAFRFKVVDRDFDENSDNADYSLATDGMVYNITTTSKTETIEHKEKNGKIRKETRDLYRAVIVFSVNLKDIQTGTIISSNTFHVESNESSSSWFGSRQSALEKAISYISREVERFYDSAYPLYADIIERAGETTNKQKEVYIDLGSKHGVYTDLTFGVYQLRTVAGREARTYLGRIKVKKVEGPDLSFCKVVSGGKDIKRCLDNDEPLLIISRH
ncbi:MAG: hypothetical protein IKI67_02100 [Bacteroidales bacterium]|nr:hypothetical protein [Bacteroidales bacterium]